MNTIFCPFDFSTASERVARYAAQLAQDTKSKVILTAIHEGNLAVAEGGDDEGKVAASEMLHEMHDQLKSDYGISCEVEAETITGNISKRVGALTLHYDLTVLGSSQNGTGGFRNLAGLDLIKVIQSSLAPLLIVPENFKYERIKRLTYAYDYTNEPLPPIEQLLWIATLFQAEVRFVSILKDSSRNEERKFESMHSEIVRQWKPEINVSFESVAYKDVTECLDHYISLWSENNLLMLSVRNQSFLETLFHKSIIKELLFSAKRPYLILHK